MEKPFKKVEHINCPNLPIITRTVITKPSSNEIIGGYQPIKFNDGSCGLWCYWENKAIHEYEIAYYIDKVVPQFMKELNNSKEFKSIPQGSFIVTKPFALNKDEVKVAVGCYFIHRNGYNIVYVGGELKLKADYRPATWDEIVELVYVCAPKPKVSFSEKIKNFFARNK